jgi:hypothetical protein
MAEAIQPRPQRKGETMPNNVQEVVLNPLAGGPGQNWKVDHNGQSGSDPAHFPHVQLPPDAGPYLIHFTIQGPNGIKFGPDPIWVQPGSKPAVSGKDQQIVAVLPSKDGKELFVVDWNHGNQTDLYYAMNFVGHGRLDPIIDNGGGNFMVWTPLQYAEAAGALLLTFAIGLFIQKQFRLLG